MYMYPTVLIFSFIHFCTFKMLEQMYVSVVSSLQYRLAIYSVSSLNGHDSLPFYAIYSMPSFWLCFILLAIHYMTPHFNTVHAMIYFPCNSQLEIEDCWQLKAHYHFAWTYAVSSTHNTFTWEMQIVACITCTVTSTIQNLFNCTDQQSSQHLFTCVLRLMVTICSGKASRP